MRVEGGFRELVVVRDTTAITTLLKIGQVQLLGNLFGAVHVPRAVWEELSVFHSRLPDFLEMHPVQPSGGLLPGTESLGKGEQEAIQLARELHANLVLIDERKGRAIAAQYGLKVAGLPAVIVLAKQENLFPSAKTLLRELECRGGLYLSRTVSNEVLTLCGEKPDEV